MKSKSLVTIGVFVITTAFSVSAFSGALAVAGAAGSILGGIGSLASAFSGVKCGDKTGVQKIDYMIAAELRRRLKDSGKLTAADELCSDFESRRDLGPEENYGYNLEDYMPAKLERELMTAKKLTTVIANTKARVLDLVSGFRKNIITMDKRCKNINAKLMGLAAREKIELPAPMQDTVQQFCR